MKIISTYGNEKLRKEQFEVLKDVLNKIKNSEDLSILLDSFLSESEKAYLGQRLDIVRMLAKGFNYQQIKETISASSGTITNAQRCLDDGGEQLKRIVLSYRYKPKKAKVDFGDERTFVKMPRPPGSILR